jgi:hypothetical protein
MVKDIDLKQIFGESTDALSDDQAKIVSGKISELVEVRVSALEFDLKEQIEAEARMKYETQLTEKTAELDAKLQEAEAYVIEKAESFKSEIIEKSRAEVDAIREDAETKVSTAEAKAETDIAQIKEETEKELSTFKDTIVTNVDEYLDLELKNAIPSDLTEAMAKLSIYEPIVEAIRGSFAQNYIRIDEESFGLLKDAKSEILGLQGELKEATKEAITHKSALVNFRRSEAISNVCEGLTEDQYERAEKLLEGYDPEVVAEKFEQIRDIIIEKNVSDDDSGSNIRSMDSDDVPSIDVLVSEDIDMDDDDSDFITEDTTPTVSPKNAEIQAHAAAFKDMFQ